MTTSSTVAPTTKRTWVTFNVEFPELQAKLNEFEDFGFAIVHVMCSKPISKGANSEYTVVAIRVENINGTPGKEIPATEPEPDLFSEGLADA